MTPMHPEQHSNESRESLEPELLVEFSPEHDIQVVNSTLRELTWLQQHGYTYHLPARIETMLQQGTAPSSAQVAEMVSAEYQSEVYRTKSNEIVEAWEQRKSDVLEKLKQLGLPLQTEYRLRVSNFGVLGGYEPPNAIDANVAQADARETIATVIHETIHLVIEDAVTAHHLDHWTKERIVDLIYGKFFPERMEVQHDPEQAVEIGRIFEQYYPHITQAIEAIAQLERRSEPNP